MFFLLFIDIFRTAQKTRMLICRKPTAICLKKGHVRLMSKKVRKSDNKTRVLKLV